MTCFKVLSINVNGLNSNFKACLPYIRDHKVDIVAFCETKIDCNSDTLLDIEGYSKKLTGLSTFTYNFGSSSLEDYDRYDIGNYLRTCFC